MSDLQESCPVRLQTPHWPAPQWRWLVWYAIVMLVVWTWQEGAREVVARVIPYSEFKEYVKRVILAECSIQKTEITGKIQPLAA